MKTAVVTDSNSGITQKEAEKLGVFVIPMPFMIDGNTYEEDISLTQGEFYERLKEDADIVIMLHPDYQYTPKLIPAMASMIAFNEYDAVIASRMLNNGALKGGMPLYKFVANKFLTFFQNFFMGQKLSEYHTGFRAFSREILENLPLAECDDDFIFDNEMLALIYFYGYNIGEISCPTKYFPEASSINFKRSTKYGFGVLGVSIKYFFARLNIFKSKIFKRGAKRLDINSKLDYYYLPEN